MSNSDVILIIQDIAIIIIGAITICVYKQINKTTKEIAERSAIGATEESFRSQIQTIQLLQVQYPHLEKEVLVGQYQTKEDLNNDDGVRYSAYCLLWLNLVERIYLYYNGNLDRLRLFVNATAFISKHKQWLIVYKAELKPSFDASFFSWLEGQMNVF